MDEDGAHRGLRRAHDLPRYPHLPAVGPPGCSLYRLGGNVEALVGTSEARPIGPCAPRQTPLMITRCCGC